MLKKIGNWLLSLISVDTAEKVATDETVALADQGLEEFFKNDPAQATALVQSFYAWIPTLAALAAKTKTDFDDKEEVALRAEIEKFAAEKGIDLPALPPPVTPS